MAKKKQPKVFFSPLDQGGAVTPVAPNAWEQGAQALADEAIRSYKAEQSSSFMDKMQAASRVSGLTSAAYKYTHTPDFDPVAGFKAPVAEAGQYTEDEWQHLKQARSPQEYRYQQIMLEHDKGDMEEMNRDGIGVGLAAGVIAMGPEAIVTGWGVAGALRVGSMANYAAKGAEAFNVAARAGKGLQAAKAAEEAVLASRPATSTMRSLLENVGGNIGATYLEDKISPEYRVSMADYGMGLLGGLVGHVAMRGSIARDAAFAEDRALVQNGVAEAYGLRNEFNVAARKELGDGADDALVKARATQMETEHFTKTLSTQQGRVAAKRLFNLDLDKLEADEIALAKAPGPLVTDDVQAPTMTEKLATFLGNSVLKKEDGTPLVYYHGTDSSFDAFNLSAAGANLGTNKMTFFSPAAEFANDYAPTKGGNVMPVVIRMEKPFDPANPAHTALITRAVLEDETANEVLHRLLDGHPSELIRGVLSGDPKALSRVLNAELSNWELLESDAVVAAVKQGGFDGMYVRENGTQNVGIFDPYNVKSVWNNGEFNRATPLVSESRAPGVAGIDPNAPQVWRDTVEYGEAMAYAPGIHMIGEVPKGMAPVVEALNRLADFMPSSSRILVNFDPNTRSYGELSAWKGGEAYLLTLMPGKSVKDTLMTAVHEVGHALDHTFFLRAPAHMQDALRDSFRQFQKNWAEGRLEEAVGSRLQIGNRAPGQTHARWDNPDYWGDNMKEWMAEQFVKYVQVKAPDLNMPKTVIEHIKDFVSKLLDVFKLAKKEAYLPPEESFSDFMDAVVTGNIEGRASLGSHGVGGASDSPSNYNAAMGIKNQVDPVPNAEMVGGTAKMAVPGSKAAPVVTSPKASQPKPLPQGPDLKFLTDPIAVKYGLDFLPVETPTQRAAAKGMIELYRKADNTEAAWNNIPAAQLDLWIAKTGFASTGTNLLKSKNPVARMVAYELLEQGSGAGGRGDSASIAKYISKRKITRNATNDIQDAYRDWAAANGIGKFESIQTGAAWERFNKAVGKELEGAAKEGHIPSTDPHIQRAAAAARNAYERARIAQVDAKVTGWAGLPETSKGYMPHKMSPAAVINMTHEQEQSLRSVLVDQFVMIEGWDVSFSANLAAKYIDRIKSRAMGGWQSNLRQQQGAAASEVEDALTAMGLSAEEVRAQLARYQRGAQGHLKGRIKLDLDQELGGGMTLRDMFEYDQVKLLTGQAERVSGEVALARHGIMGRPGMKLILESISTHGGQHRATTDEIGAFEQVFSEFLGEQIGNSNKNVDRAIQLTSLIRMGGMGFNQLGEYINGIWKVGTGATLETIGSFNRLRGEAAALARGEKVENSLLGSIETMHGVEFGVDPYRIHFPFGAADREIDTIHSADNTMIDRLLRGGLEVQAKWSGWRAINAAQQRGFAEQLVLKTLRAVREGGMTKELQDIGITPELEAGLKQHIDRAAKFGPDGRVAEFDVSKLPPEIGTSTCSPSSGAWVRSSSTHTSARRASGRIAHGRDCSPSSVASALSRPRSSGRAT
jgi:hypothetical protein